MKIPSIRCHKTSLMKSQHSFKQCLCAVRQQALARAIVDLDWWIHMASLGQNELEQIQSRCEMHSIGVSDIQYLFHSTVSHCRNSFVFYLGVTVLQHQLFKCFRGTVYNHIPAGSWSDEVGTYIVYLYIHMYIYIYVHTYICMCALIFFHCI